MLVAIAVLPLVVGAISVALLAIFNNENQTSSSLTASGDAQVTSSIFDQDVQSAAWISETGLDVCDIPVVGASLVLSLSPDSVPFASIQNVISYVKVQNSSSTTFTVSRYTCTRGTGSAVSSARVVAHNAVYDCSSTLSVAPAVPVQNQLWGTGNPCTSALLPNGGWVPGSGTSQVTLSLNEPYSKGSSTSSNNYALSAAPRVSGIGGAAPGGISPIVPLTLLGSCPSPAVKLNGHSLTDQGGSGFVGSTQSQATCGNGLVPNLVSATPYEFNVTNPFQGLTPPLLTPPQPTSPPDPGSCTNNVCTAGYYPSTFNVPDGYSFDPSLSAPGHPSDKGSVEFQGPISLSNCTSGITFRGGSNVSSTTYIFDNGLTINKCSSVSFGSAAYVFQTTTPPSHSGQGANLFTADKSTINYTGGTGGLILYMSGVNSGTVNISNAFSGTDFYDPPSGPYEGIVLWDDSSGSLSLGQGNGGNIGVVWNGGIYAPNATITLGGGYNSFSVTFMVIDNLTQNGNASAVTG
jgi:hypothetical protein